MNPHHENHMKIFSYHKYPHLMMMMSTLFLMTSLYLYYLKMEVMMEWTIMSVNSNIMSFPIIMEADSLLFMFTVSFISFNVLLFSKVYMSDDINIHRFTQMVMLFIGSMMMLILCPNTMIMLLGWDGLGITSFLLVIYYHNPRSLKSGMITLATNRIGDCMILMSIVIIASQGHWSMDNMWKESMEWSTLLSFLIMSAAITKSAQFPFMAWLTCAMAAPTPVSALVHSSTLVTAGVFLIIRFYSFLSEFTQFSAMLLSVGGVTMFYASTWAMTKKDIKETIALSTMSQLGLMISTLGLGMKTFCFFHLLTHAMFKATMFMSAGMIIKFKLHRQNWANTKMKSHARSCAIALGMSVLSMNAVFFMSGYYSKDLILEMVLYSPSMYAWIGLYVAATSMTATYSVRLIRSGITTKSYHKTFFRKNIQHNISKVNIISNKMSIIRLPMYLMTIMTVCMGSMTYSLILNPGDLPILESKFEILPMLLPINGVLTAVSYCPSNKIKMATRPMEKMLYKMFNSKMKKMMKKNPMKIIMLTNRILMKLNLKKYSHKLSSNKSCFSPFKSVSVIKMKETSRIKMKMRASAFYVKANYKWGLPMMKLASSIEKNLELSAYKFMGPLMSEKLPMMSYITLKMQKSSISNILLTIWLLMLFILPVILYDHI